MAGFCAAVCLLWGCSKGQNYATVPPDIADSFPLEAEEAGDNPQLARSDGPYAVLHTTAGDITILLYREQAPKAVENFIGLARSGYYDKSRFHYVKKDELAQTGKPPAQPGARTPEGEPLLYGEEKSLWEEPFEDEFYDGLHNFTGAVGMAGNGKDNNLSQFYLLVKEEKPEDRRIPEAGMYLNELVRAETERLNQMSGEKELTQEQVKKFEDQLNDKIQQVGTDGVPENYARRYEKAVERYMERGGAWSLDYQQTVFGQIVKGLNVARAITQVKVEAENRKPKKDIVIESIEILERLE